MRMREQVRDYQTKNSPQSCLVVPGSVEGDPARHNSGSSPKTCVFPGEFTPPCQFSIWRAGGVAAQKRLICCLFSTARHFALWRAARVAPGKDASEHTRSSTVFSKIMPPGR